MPTSVLLTVSELSWKEDVAAVVYTVIFLRKFSELQGKAKGYEVMAYDGLHSLFAKAVNKEVKAQERIQKWHLVCLKEDYL